MPSRKSKREVQLPKGYLSYSQVQLWLNDPERYKKLYFDERDDLRTSNSGQEYGKVVADLLERGERSEDLLTDTAMELLPQYDLRDQEFKATLPTSEGDIHLLFRPDSLDSFSHAFYEYKTGKHAWTQKKAQDHLQMHFYALGIYLTFGHLPPAGKLIWIETEVEEKTGDMGLVTKTIKPTGRVEEFPVTFTTRSNLETMALITKAAKEIEIAFAQYTPDPRIATF